MNKEFELLPNKKRRFFACISVNLRSSASNYYLFRSDQRAHFFTFQGTD